MSERERGGGGAREKELGERKEREKTNRLGEDLRQVQRSGEPPLMGEGQ